MCPWGHLRLYRERKNYFTISKLRISTIERQVFYKCTNSCMNDLVRSYGTEFRMNKVLHGWNAHYQNSFFKRKNVN